MWVLGYVSALLCGLVLEIGLGGSKWWLPLAVVLAWMAVYFAVAAATREP